MSARDGTRGPAAIATLHSDVPDEMTLVEYRRLVKRRPERRRRRPRLRRR